MASRTTPAAGAAEIVKGDRKVMTISESEVARLLDPAALLDALAEGFRALSRKEFQMPQRPEISVPERGFLLAMPAWRPGAPMMVKMVCVFEGNLQVGLPNHLAMITLYDEATGLPLCVMDGTHITGIRTAGAAVLSVRELAPRDARVATIIGAGVQGREHLGLLPLVRDFEEILIHSLHHEDAEKLARCDPRASAVTDLEDAVRRSDVICLCSHAYEPVIEPGWARPGSHVSSVGYTPWPGELPQELARRHSLFVEDLSAFLPQPVGCAELEGLDPAAATPIGDVLTGDKPGRRDDQEITVYKAMGIAMEDLVAAELVYRRALEEGCSTGAVF